MITERMQCEIIHRYFVDAGALLGDEDPAQWAEPWRSIFLLAERQEGVMGGLAALRSACRAVAADDEQAHGYLRRIYAAAEPLTFPTLAEIGDNLPPVAWLWDNWLPRGMLTVLGAYQGTGKSYFVLDLARTVIAGGAWPDGTPVRGNGTAIYVEAEAIPQVTNQRAKALGVDRNQLYLLMADNGEILDLTDRRWQDRLVDMVYVTKPELVIVDSFTSISSVGQNSVEETNALLMFLVGLARWGNCGMLVLHHLRKPPGGQLALPGMSIHDFRGSGHITAMGRVIMGLNVVQSGRQFTLNGPRRLDMVKTNLGPYAEPIGITLQQLGPEAVKFEYGKPASYDQADAEVETCDAWLLGYLGEHGPTSPQDVIADGETEGYSRRTIYRTRKVLEGQIVNSQRTKNHPRALWMLPGQGEEETEDVAE